MIHIQKHSSPRTARDLGAATVCSPLCTDPLPVCQVMLIHIQKHSSPRTARDLGAATVCSPLCTDPLPVCQVTHA